MLKRRKLGLKNKKEKKKKQMRERKMEVYC